QLFPPESASATAVVIPDGGPTLTYSRLTDQISALAQSLRQGGIRTGDPVAIVLPNSVEFLTTFLAATWARAIAAPLNPAYKVEEFRFYMEDAGVRAVIVPPGPHPARAAADQLHLPLWQASLKAECVALEKLADATAVPHDDGP